MPAAFLFERTFSWSEELQNRETGNILEIFPISRFIGMHKVQEKG
jgi:hypothetical protein